MYLRRFDPWKNEFCTCPPKFSLNPYTGCAHGCIYCYASSYIKDFFKCREKPNLIARLNTEIKKLSPHSLISLCNTSDPYPPMEMEKRLTRKCLQIFKEYGMRVLIITKSDIVCRDIDLLKEMQTAVTMTITTLKYYDKLEPNAPSPERRLQALERLNKEGIATGLRLDPIIPFINDTEVESILKLAKNSGVMHVTASTFKPRWDSWGRLIKVFPALKERLKDLYIIKGQKIRNTYYLNSLLRESIISSIKAICDSLDLTFSNCRENLAQYGNTRSCDGSHLIEGGV